MWDFFKFRGTQIKGVNKAKVYCSLCLTGKTKSAAEVSYSVGTTNLSSHLRKHHPDEYSKKEDDKKPNTITAYMNSSDSKPGYRWPKPCSMWKTATRNLAMWLCKNSRRSNLVLDEGFRAFIRFLCPQYKVPCPNRRRNL